MTPHTTNDAFISLWYNAHSMKHKNLIQIGLAIGLAAIGLYLTLRGVDFRRVAVALRQAEWKWIGLTILCILISLVIRAQRWRILLDRKLSLRDTFGLTGIGYLVSNIFPLRAGDPARAVAASLRGPVSAMTALSTVVVERALDLLAAALLLLFTLPFVPGLGDSLTTGLISGGFSLTILLGLIVMAVYPQQVEALARRVLTLLHISNPERWLRPLQGIMKGLKTLRSPREGLRLAFWSLALWGAIVAYFATALRAFIPNVPPLAGTVITWATAFGMAVPAPGGIGSAHYAIRLALTLGFGFPEETAVTYAVVVHTLQYLIGTFLGAGALMAWGLSLKHVVVNEQELDTAPDPCP